MTAERIRDCRRTRSNATNTVEKLQGLTPVIEDWHLLFEGNNQIIQSSILSMYVYVFHVQDIWKRLCNTASGTDSYFKDDQ